MPSRRKTIHIAPSSSADFRLRTCTPRSNARQPAIPDSTINKPKGAQQLPDGRAATGSPPRWPLPEAKKRLPPGAQPRIDRFCMRRHRNQPSEPRSAVTETDRRRHSPRRRAAGRSTPAVGLPPRGATPSRLAPGAAPRSAGPATASRTAHGPLAAEPSPWAG